MALPYRTFAQSQALIQVITANKITAANIGTLYNFAYREILESHQWAARKTDTIINTVAEYTTGTVSVTSGSATVTGSGTTWVAATHECLFIRVAEADQFYKIASITNATSLILEAPWPGATASAQTYAIFGLYYALPTDCSVPLGIFQQDSQSPIYERSLPWLLQRDPARRTTSDTPQAWVPHGFDTSNRLLVEFWPRFASATSVRLPYLVRVDDLSGSSQPLIRPDVIEAKTIAYCCDRLYAEFGDPHWVRLREVWKADFAELYDAARREDLDRHNTPRAVQEASGGGAPNWGRYIVEDWD